MSVPAERMSVPAKSLFESGNLDVDRMRLGHWLLLLLWTPLGVPIMLCRAAFTILASLIVPPRYRAWWVSFIGGTFLVVRNRTRIRDHGVVVVSNHISYFDGVTVRAAIRSQVPLATLVWHKVNWLNKYMARPTIGVHQTGRNRALRDDVLRHLEHGNILLFPEATVTDGHGILRFEKMAFTLDKPVVLVAVRYRRALPFLHPTALREHQFVQLWYDLFQPWVAVELHCLGQFTRATDEEPEQFAARAQATIADALGIPATDYTWRDRRRLLKSLGRDRSESKRRKAG